ncbi:hypothetical protein [uncultured Gammaproteobacteria bacterium]|nr:hypothetical protein [uncultured Gammaproteobacteria bacterium]
MRYFTRYLCSIASNLNINCNINNLLENIFEESGFDKTSCSISHSQLYKEMLVNLNVDVIDIKINPETQALINTVFSLCRQASGIKGLGAVCFGIEAIVPKLYALILKGMLANNIEKNNLEFFNIHINCDDGHAENIYQTLIKCTNGNAALMQQAIEAGKIVTIARVKFLDSLI